MLLASNGLFQIFLRVVVCNRAQRNVEILMKRSLHRLFGPFAVKGFLSLHCHLLHLKTDGYFQSKSLSHFEKICLGSFPCQLCNEYGAADFEVRLFQDTGLS